MRVVVAAESTEAREQLRQLVLGVGLECGAADCVAFADLPMRLASTGTDLILLAVGASVSPVLSIIPSALHIAPVIVVGPPADPQTVVQVLRSGAREYVVVERFREEFPVALERLQQAGAIHFQIGRTVAVIAANPGSGVTTVANNLAFALADKHPGKVALAEVGSGVPETALDLDLQPQHTVEELIHDWERMDARMIRQTLVAHAAGVQVLAHSPETLEPTPITPAAMRQTVLLLRTLFDFTVLDLGHSLTDTAREAMNLSDTVVIVVRLDVPSLRLGRQFLRRLAQRGVPASKIRLVANRYGQRRQVAWKKAEEALGLKVHVWLPDDPATLNHALNQGQPLIQTARRAQITRRLDELAQQVNGKMG
jgi:pilus assembly protein CpaE